MAQLSITHLNVVRFRLSRRLDKIRRTSSIGEAVSAPRQRSFLSDALRSPGRCGLHAYIGAGEEMAASTF